MSYLYVESSALVRALTEGDGALAMRIVAARRAVTSALTRLEVARALARKAEDRSFSRDLLEAAQGRLALFAEAAGRIPVSEEILAEAASRFPVEPVRTVDAIHLASCILLQRRAGKTVVATVDNRVRANALALGMAVLPE
ncbi:MAG: type II toxin-antitoxin system VapC family toxin [Candidatus Sericytochromatia bacterium]|nr:type II toxin-antitoxin system VapC family toxin [Candidatus Tanganyikabacteria bacterium]